MENKNMRNIKKFKNGFSLIEMLLALVLASVIFIVAATSIAKHNVPKKREGVVYTYSPENNTTTDNLCYITTGYIKSASYTHIENYKMTHSCSEYTFTVPDDVNLINLTLVGGGGGGTATSEVRYDGTYETNVPVEGIQNFKIKYLIAQGQDGSNQIETTDYQFKYGSNGKASPIIYDFEIPRNYYWPENFPLIKSHGESNFYLYLRTAVEKGARSSLYVSFLGYPSTYGLNSFGYFVKNDGTLGCLNSSKSETDKSECELTSANYIDGRDSSQKPYTGKTTVGIRYGGGRNYPSISQVASLSDIILKYGYGGAGADIQVTCPHTHYEACDSNYTATAQIYKSAEKGGPPYVSYEINMKQSSLPGTGGASGTVARILNFPVTPGATYKIVVGKGGRGGRNEIINNVNTSSVEGGGGTSTAIFDSSNNLVYMVTGGAGGITGSYSSAYNGISDIQAASARNLSKVVYGGLAPEIDPNLATTTSCGSDFSGFSNYSRAICLKYKALEEEPYKTLNLSGNTESRNGAKYGSFSHFQYTGYYDTDEYLHYHTSDNADIYNGFYYRRLLNNTPAEIGGLGGFSGFGGKAACGAYFMGNYDALDKDGNKLDDSLRKKYINKMFVNDDWYNVFSYYEGCNTDSSDGVTAKFVAPDPVKLDFGRAGIGGGGAGYNIEKGPGNGGDGQDGYLMIDWVR